MTQNLQFEPAEQYDVDMLVSFYRQCREETDMGILPEYFQSLPDGIFRAGWEFFFAEPGRYKAKLARVNGDLAGFYKVGPIGEEDRTMYLSDCGLPADCGELHQIYLLRRYHAQGLGRRLYEEAQRDLKALGYCSFVACTYAENQKARDFYAAMGACLLTEAVLDVAFSGKPWKRPVVFMLQEMS